MALCLERRWAHGTRKRPTVAVHERLVRNKLTRLAESGRALVALESPLAVSFLVAYQRVFGFKRLGAGWTLKLFPNSVDHFDVRTDVSHPLAADMAETALRRFIFSLYARV